jgi:hypothetical protein
MDTNTTALSCFVRVACAFGGSDGLVPEHLTGSEQLLEEIPKQTRLTSLVYTSNCV